MIDIPANYATNFALKVPVLYVIRILGGGVYTFASRSGLTITFGGSTITPVYTDYFAINIDGSPAVYIGEIDCQIDLSRGGAVAGLNETTLQFLNQARFDQFVSEYSLENKRIKIYEGYIANAGTIDVLDDMIQIYDGVIQNADQWNYKTFTIPCYDRRVRDDKLIPRRKIVEADYADCPQDNLGKYIPFVNYGDSFTAYPSDDRIKYKNFLPVVQTKKNILTTSEYYQFHVSDDILTPPGLPSKVIYSDGIWYGEFDNATYAIDDGTYIKIQEATATFYLRPASLHVISVGGKSMVNCIDNNISTYESLSGTDTLWFLLGSDISVPGQLKTNTFESHDNQVNTDIAFYFYVDGLPTGTPKIYYLQTDTESNKIECSGAVADLYNITLEGWTVTINNAGWWRVCPLNALGNNLLNTDWDNLWKTKWGIYANGGSIKISEVYVCVKASIADFNFPMHTTSLRFGDRQRFSHPYLRHYVRRGAAPEAIDSLDSFVFFEGFINRNRSEGLQAFTPAYSIKDILQYQLGVPSPVISWTGAHTARTSWYCQFVILERTKALDVIGQICFEHALGLWVDLTGTYQVFTLDTRSTDFAITSTDIALDVQGIPRIEIKKSSIRNLVNDMHVQYGYSHVHKKHMKNVYIGDIDGNNSIVTNLTADSGAPIGSSYTDFLENSIAKYSIKNTAEYNFDTIIDTATAEASIKKLADWLGYKRLIVTLDVMKNANTLRLRLGDIVTLDTGILDDVIVSNVKYFITGLNIPPVGYYVQPYITLVLTEIPSAYMDWQKTPDIPDMYEYVTGVA